MSATDKGDVETAPSALSMETVVAQAAAERDRLKGERDRLRKQRDRLTLEIRAIEGRIDAADRVARALVKRAPRGKTAGKP